MQKLDFFLAVEELVDKLNSVEIVEMFETALGMENYEFNGLIPVLFDSKSNFDLIYHNNLNAKSIIDALNGANYYAPGVLSSFSLHFREKRVATVIRKANHLFDFYSFHSSLLDFNYKLKEILIDDDLTKLQDEQIDKGYLIFEIISDEAVTPLGFSQIFKNLAELFEKVNELLEIEEPPKVVLLDSGSDSNAGIKAAAEAAKLIFETFKEIWDYIFYRKFNRADREDEALLKSMTMRAEVQKRVEEGVITKKEGDAYEHYIRTRINKLIDLNTVPKSIAKGMEVTVNRNLLDQINQQRQLRGGDSTDE